MKRASLTHRERGAIHAHDAAVRAIAGLRAKQQLDLFESRGDLFHLWAAILLASLAEGAR